MTNVHFKLQSEQCGLSVGLKYRYLRVEDMAHWYREVVCLLGLQRAVSSGWNGGCFVRTPDCGCVVSCEGNNCSNMSSSVFAGATYANKLKLKLKLKHNESARTFYSKTLAGAANAWAAADLHTLGYKPWSPSDSFELQAALV